MSSRESGSPEWEAGGTWADAGDLGLSFLQDRGSELWIKDLNLGRTMCIGLIHTHCIHVSTEVLKVICGIGGS